MPHLVLLGDSIFDNGRYTKGGPDVISQVRRLLPQGWTATLLAVDGAKCDEVAGQMRRLPKDATHLVLSIGGNDARVHASVLDTSASSTAQAAGYLADLADLFEPRYRAAVQACLASRLPLAVCTIYNGCFPEPAYQRIVSIALMVFNDTILRTAIEHALPVIDLRSICAAPEDYANPIEPSSIGGEKTARAIVDLVAGGRSAARTLSRPAPLEMPAAFERPLSRHPYAERIGLVFEEQRAGHSRCVLNVAEDHLNPHGVMHGAVIYSLADTGMGAALYPTLEPGEICATIEIKINYFKPVVSGVLACVTELVNRGKTVANLESTVHCGDVLVAKANGNYSIFRPARGIR